MSQLLDIALDQLSIPAWNPRDYINPTELADLVAYLENGGLIPRILVFKETEGHYSVISGQRRVAAYRQLGRTHIEAEVLDITLRQAKVMAMTTNEGVKPFWLDDYERVEALLAEDPSLSQRGLAAELGRPKSAMNRTALVLKVLNPASRTLIKQWIASQKPLNSEASVPTGDTLAEEMSSKWQLGDRVAYQLTPLLNNRPLEEAQALAEEALKVVLARQLTGPQVAALVKWVQAGHPAESFDHKAAKTAAKPKVTATSEQAAHTTPVAEVVQSVPHADSLHLGAHAAHVSPESAQPSRAAHPVGEQQAMGSAETALYEAVAGMSVIAKVRAKIKKGERPNLFEVLLLGGYNLWRGLVWLVKNGFRLAKLAFHWTLKAVKFIWQIVIDSLKVLGIYQFARAVVVLALLICLLIAGWYIHTHSAGETMHFVYSKVFAGSSNSVEPAQPNHVTNSSSESVQYNHGPQQVTSADGHVSQQVPAPVNTPIADSSHQDTLASTPESAQPNHGSQLVASTQAPTSVPTKVVAKVKVKHTQVVQITPTPNAKGNINGPLAQSNPAARPVNSQQTPQGDIFSQGADVATKGAGIAKAFGL